MTVSIRPSVSPLRDHYRLTRVAGSDESADDYLAIDQRDGREVLVRVIRPGAVPSADARESVLGRLAVAATFERPDVLPIREVGLDAGRLFVVRDRPLGPSLAERLQAGPAPVAWSARAIAAALRTVDSARDHDVVHPGLTPGSIYVAANGSVQVSEFGLPLLPSAAVLTASSHVPPSVHVRAPELVAGSGAGPAAQVYAAAAILYWLVSGRPVYEGTSLGDVRELHRTGPDPDTSAIEVLGPDLTQLLIQSLSKDPANRADLLADLLSALDQTALTEPASAEAPPVSFWKELFRPGGKYWASRRLVWVSASVAACALVAGVGLIGPARAAIQSIATPVSPEAQRRAPSLSPPPAPPIERSVTQTTAQPNPAGAFVATADRCWGSDWSCTIDQLAIAARLDATNSAVIEKLAIARYNFGIELARADDLVGAAREFGLALAQRPTFPEATRALALTRLYVAGSAAYDRGDWLVAGSSFGEVVAADRQYGKAVDLAYASWTNLGVQALRSADIGRAQEACQNALSYRSGAEAQACLDQVNALLALRTQPVRPVVAQPRPIQPVVILPAPIAPVETKAPPASGRARTPTINTFDPGKIPAASVNPYGVVRR